MAKWSSITKTYPMLALFHSTSLWCYQTRYWFDFIYGIFYLLYSLCHILRDFTVSFWALKFFRFCISNSKIPKSFHFQIPINKNITLSFKSPIHSMSLLAIWRHIREDAEQKVSFQAGVKGRGYDDIPTLSQLNAEEHRAWVDVDAPTNFLLGDMHTVDPVQLHLCRETAAVFTAHTECLL